MSIKQNGGVFGRNPTFNDVTIEGELTFDGDVDISSDLKIDGNLEVTGTSTIKALTVNTTDANHKISGGAGDIYTLYAGRSATDYYIGRDASGAILAVTGTAAPLLLKTNNTTRLNISTGGDVAVSTGNLVMSTSGKGIDFSATAGSGTSELLSDYEEGTFTVTTNGDASGAFSAETGEYTKIGNVVYIKITFRVSANFASNKIGGLPFTPSYDAGASGKTMVGTLLTSSSSSAPIAGGAVNGADYIEFFASNSTASTFAPNTANDYHRLQGFYYTA